MRRSGGPFWRSSRQAALPRPPPPAGRARRRSVPSKARPPRHSPSPHRPTSPPPKAFDMLNRDDDYFSARSMDTLFRDRDNQWWGPGGLGGAGSGWVGSKGCEVGMGGRLGQAWRVRVCSEGALGCPRGQGRCVSASSSLPLAPFARAPPRPAARGDASMKSRQSAAVDAHWGAGTTLRYYKDAHGRDGIDGKGSKITSRVHASEGFNNAYCAHSCCPQPRGPSFLFVVWGRGLGVRGAPGEARHDFPPRTFCPPPQGTT